MDLYATLNRVHAVMENLKKSWNLNDLISKPGEVIEIFKNVESHGK